MRTVTLFVAVLLCVHSFRADAGGGKSTWLRNAHRAVVTKVSKITATAIMPLALAAAMCTNSGCDRVDVPDYAGVIGADVHVFNHLGISRAEAERLMNMNMVKPGDYRVGSLPEDYKGLRPSDYSGKLVVFKQNDAYEVGVAFSVGNHRDFVVVEGREQKDQLRATIVRLWDVKGVLVNNGGNEGKYVSVMSDNIMLKAGGYFEEEQAARQLLQNEQVVVSGQVISEFIGSGGNILMFVPIIGAGFEPREDVQFDLGIRGLLDEPLRLFTTVDKVISMTARGR